MSRPPPTTKGRGTDLTKWKIGVKYELNHLWCPNHKTWWDESRYGKCPECGHQTNKMPSISICDKTDTPPSPREAVLREAALAITQDRNLDYGPPEDNFDDIARLWRVYLKGRAAETIDGADVAAMSVLIKVARLRTSKGKKDHWVDIAGYAGCGFQCTEAKK